MEQPLERKILIDRFFSSDRSLYNLGSKLGISWFQNFDAKFGRDQYAYFTPEEKIEASRLITEQSDDLTFVNALNSIGPPKYMPINRFVGERYHFDGTKFSLEDNRAKLHEDFSGAIRETGRRGFDFLKGLYALHNQGKWDNAYGGATWPDILAKIREMRGTYPSPRDLSILKSYGVYYRTGSRRYPTHTIPEEMIPIVKDYNVMLFQTREEAERFVHSRRSSIEQIGDIQDMSQLHPEINDPTPWIVRYREV